MKVFLGVDMTDKKNPVASDVSVFKTKELSQISKEALQTSYDQMDDVQQKASLPKVLKIALYVFGLAFAICLVGLVRSMDDVSLATAYQNAPFIFWIGGVSGILCLCLYLYGRYRVKVVAQDEKTGHVLNRLGSAVDNAFDELGVPADASYFDVLCFRYVIKNGNAEFKDVISGCRAAIPFEFKAYTNGQNLCLADPEQVLEIPLSCFEKITTTNKRIMLNTWNKTEPFKKGVYANYNIKSIDGNPAFKPYHVLHFCHNGEKWGIYFPCYELPVIEKLTGLVAEQEEK